MANLTIFPIGKASSNLVGLPQMINGVQTGCTISNAGGVFTGSFINLSLNNTIQVTASGEFTIVMVAPYTGTVTGASSATLVTGSNTITSPIGTLTITLSGDATTAQTINLQGEGVASTNQIGLPQLTLPPVLFDASPTPQSLQVWLCKPDLPRTPIAKLAEANVITQKGQLLYKTVKYRKNGAKVTYVKTHTTRFGSVNEINICIPLYLDDITDLDPTFPTQDNINGTTILSDNDSLMLNHSVSINPHFNLCKERYLLKVQLGNTLEYYTIDEIKKDSSMDVEEKNIHAYGLGYEMNDKIVTNFTTTIGGVAGSWNAYEALSNALSGTIWGIGYIDPGGLTVFRSFSSSNDTVLNTVYTIAQSFSLVPVFDSIGRNVSLWNQDNLGINRGLTVGDSHYLDTMEVDVNCNELCTRLYMYGQNNMTLASVTATGNDYIEAYDWFMNPYACITGSTNLLNSFQSHPMILPPLNIVAGFNSSGGTLSIDNTITSWLGSSSGNINWNTCGKFVTTSSGSNYVELQGNMTLGSYTDAWQVTIAQPITFSAYLQTDGTQTIRLGIIELNSSGGVITEIDGTYIKPTSWTRQTYTYTPTSGVAGVLLRLEVSSTGSAWFDCLQLEQNGSASNWILGGLTEITSVITSSDYMSDDLCTALTNYENLITANQNDSQTILTQLNNLQNQLIIEEDNLSNYNEQLTGYQQQLDALNATGDANTTTTNQSTLLSQIANAQTLVDNENNVIAGINTNIANVDNMITALGILLAVENNFTSAQIREWNPFIISKYYSDSNCSDPQSLYTEGLQYFSQICNPPITITTSMVNFLEVVECSTDWEKLNLGDIITVSYPNMDVLVQTKIIEIDFDYTEGSIKLVISDIKEILTAEQKFIRNITQAVSSSASLDMSSYKYEAAYNTANSVQEVLSNTWSADQTAISAANDTVSISTRGITISSPTDSNNLVQMTNGVIGFSQDGGNSLSLAIDNTGVYAPSLYGEIIVGEQLLIDMSNSTSGVTYFQVSNKNNNPQVLIDGATLEITNFQESPIAQQTVLVNNPYNDVTISSTNGILCNYEMPEGTINVTSAAVSINGQSGITINTYDGSTETQVLWINTTEFNNNPPGSLCCQNLVAVNANVTGEIDCTALNISGVPALTTDSVSGNLAIAGTSIATGTITANQIQTGSLIVGTNVAMGSNASISWGQVSGTPTIPTTAAQVGAVANNQTAVFNTLTNNGSLSGLFMQNNQLYVNASYINGGTITGVTINVGTNCTIGNDLTLNNTIILSNTNYEAGIQWGTSNTPTQRIYVDPASGAICLGNAGSGGIYANGQRLDVAPIAVFG